jgi:hypothetical protein
MVNIVTHALQVKVPPQSLKKTKQKVHYNDQPVTTIAWGIPLFGHHLHLARSSKLRLAARAGSCTSSQSCIDSGQEFLHGAEKWKLS